MASKSFMKRKWEPKLTREALDVHSSVHGSCLGASIFFKILPYKVNTQTCTIGLRRRQWISAPKLLIFGGSSYPLEWECARYSDIADRCGAVLLCDIGHVSCLIANNVKGNVVFTSIDYEGLLACLRKPVGFT